MEAVLIVMSREKISPTFFVRVEGEKDRFVAGAARLRSSWRCPDTKTVMGMAAKIRMPTIIKNSFLMLLPLWIYNCDYGKRQVSD